MAIKPILSCPICHKRVKTTQGLQGHVRFKHPELVPGYDRPEFARLKKLTLSGSQILHNLDKYYSGLSESTQVNETLLRCPSCERPMLIVAIVETGELPFYLFSRADDELIKIWRAAQVKIDVMFGERRGWIDCTDLVAAEDEYGKHPQMMDISQVPEL